MNATIPTVRQALRQFLAEEQHRLPPEGADRCRGLLKLVELKFPAFMLVERGAPQDTYWTLKDTTPASKLAPALRHFLDNFVAANYDRAPGELRTAPGIIRRLAEWLGIRGYAAPNRVAEVCRHARRLHRELPRAHKLSRLLRNAPGERPWAGDPDILYGYFEVLRMEGHRVWLTRWNDGLTYGLFTLPRLARETIGACWHVSATLRLMGDHWALVRLNRVQPPFAVPRVWGPRRSRTLIR